MSCLSCARHRRPCTHNVHPEPLHARVSRAIEAMSREFSPPVEPIIPTKGNRSHIDPEARAKFRKKIRQVLSQKPYEKSPYVESGVWGRAG